MPLTTLRLENFRNFSELSLELSPSLNVLEGGNAQGKTNMLEAIYVLANGRSFRTSQRGSLLQEGQTQARLETEILHRDLISKLTGSLTVEEKRFTLNGKTLTRWEKLWEIFRVLIFTPESTAWFRSSPAGRRNYLDQAIATHFRSYRPVLRRYGRVVSQRNQLLEGRAPRELLEPYSQQWAELAGQILLARREYLKELLPRWRERLSQLTSTAGELNARWEGRVSNLEPWGPDVLLQALESVYPEESRRCHTVLGPHREDLGVYLVSRPVREVASQGQQRMLTIALKLAEADLFVAKTGLSPTFLLDDIGSELDPRHLNRLLQTLGELHSQTLLTTAHRGEYASLGARTFQVKRGQIQS